MSKPRLLSENFVPEEYSLDILPNGLVNLTILGRKIGRPAKRITLHQKDLKILNAVVTKLDKTGEHALSIERINHHARFEEVRLHSSDMVFPGVYRVELTYRLDRSRLGKLTAGDRGRELVPSIDEGEEKASYNIRHAKDQV